MSQLFEKVGIKYRASRVPFALRHFDPHMLLIAATRYFMGRMTIATCSFAREELARAWPEIPEHTRRIIRLDLEEAFLADDRDRESGSGYRALGWDCDRASWEHVRKAWSGQPAPVFVDAAREDIVKRLRIMADQMTELAKDMKPYDPGEHHLQLMGAGRIALMWSEEIQKAGDGE